MGGTHRVCPVHVLPWSDVVQSAGCMLENPEARQRPKAHIGTSGVSHLPGGPGRAYWFRSAVFGDARAAPRPTPAPDEQERWRAESGHRIADEAGLRSWLAALWPMGQAGRMDPGESGDSAAFGLDEHGRPEPPAAADETTMPPRIPRLSPCDVRLEVPRPRFGGPQHQGRRFHDDARRDDETPGPGGDGWFSRSLFGHDYSPP